MIKIGIPGFGQVDLKYVVLDFTGTLSEDGRLMPGIKTRLNTLAQKLKVYVFTSDTFGAVVSELKGVNCVVKMVSKENGGPEKEKFVKKLGQANVAAIGNGNNDAQMLKAARLGIAVTLKEGSAVSALMAADISVNSAADALDLLLHPIRCKATLRC